MFEENPTAEFMRESMQTEIERNTFVSEQNLPLLANNENTNEAVETSPIQLPNGFDTLNDRDIVFENAVQNSQHTIMKQKFVDENSMNRTGVSCEANTLPNTQATPENDQ